MAETKCMLLFYLSIKSVNPFHLVSIRPATCSFCFVFYKFLSLLQMGAKNCRAEPLHKNNNSMNDRLLICGALLDYRSPTWSMNRWIWGSEGGFGSVQRPVHSCVRQRCVPSVPNASVCASFVHVVLKVWSHQAKRFTKPRENRSAEAGEGCSRSV